MRYLASLFVGGMFAAAGWAEEPGCAAPYAAAPQPTCAAPAGCLGGGLCQNPSCTRCRLFQPQPQPCQVQPPCGGTCDSKLRSGPPSPTPRQGPEQPAEQSTTRETGFYQAPPRSGAFQGATNSLGMSLGGLTFPEIRFRLPSIELPNLYRSRQGARMLVEPAQAPWVSTGVETVRTGPGGVATTGAEAPGADVNRGGDAKSRGLPTPDCEDVKREYEEKVRQLQRKIDDCEKLRRCMEDCLKTYPQAAAELSGRQGNRLFGEASPPATPNPVSLVPWPTLAAPEGSHNPSPSALQPAAFTAPSSAAPESLGVRRVSTLQEPQRLPPTAESVAARTRLSQVTYEAPMEPHHAARRLPPDRLPTVP